MRKFRPPLSEHDKAELDRLTRLDFSSYTEADVREEYLIQILNILGYRKDLDYSVSREESFSLNKLFLSVGSTRIRLDYICSLRKQYFWLIDAKSGKCDDKASPPTIKEDDICQAFFYSLHPSINCKYFVVSNGWYINLYDRDLLDNDLEPVLSIFHTELNDRFLELDYKIGCTQIMPHLKQQSLQHLEKVLAAEVDLHRLDEFRFAVDNVINKVRPTVLENFRRNAKFEQEAREKEWKELLQIARPYEIVESLFQVAYTRGMIADVASELVNKVKGEKWSNHFLLFHKLFLLELRPVFYWHHVNVMAFLMALYDDEEVKEVDFAFGGGGKSKIEDLVNYWLNAVLFCFSDRRELRLMYAFEGLFYRLFKMLILMIKSTRDTVSNATEFEKFLLPEERVAWMGPCEARTLINAVESATLRAMGTIVSKYRDNSKRDFKFALAMDEYKATLAFYDSLKESVGQDYFHLKQELGDSWSELCFFDCVFNGFDPVVCGVLEILTHNSKALRMTNDRIKAHIGLLAGLGFNYAKECCVAVGVEPLAIDAESQATLRNVYFDPASNVHTLIDQLGRQ